MMLLDDRSFVVAARVSDDAQALIKEARRRTRRRRLTGISVCLLIVVFGAVVYSLGFGVQVTAKRPSAPPSIANLKAFRGRGILAFVSKGRLWVLDGESSTLTAVSVPSDQASDPQFSPNGRWLSFGVRTPSGAGEIWLARANGSAPRRVAADVVAQENWLSDGRLLTGSWILRVSSRGSVTRVDKTPNDIAAASPDSQRYAFATSRVVDASRVSTGVARLEVSSSINGKRTTWYQDPISFTPKTGIRGNYLSDVAALPGQEGILFQLDPDGSNSLAADGLNLYEIQRPGARPVKLGVTVGLPLSVGPRGMFAITTGGNRYAWQTKSVEVCLAATARCSPLHTKHGTLSFDPAWSKTSGTLALVEAPSSSATNFYQATLRRWYASHTLWVLRKGSNKPTEIRGGAGADAPTWSANGKSLIYEAADVLWLLPNLSSKPIRVAGPLFPPSNWPSYYGQIGWVTQFAWLSHH